MLKKVVLPILFCLLPAALTAQSSLEKYDRLLSSAGFEENWEARQHYRETINAPFYSMMHAPSVRIDQVMSPVSVKFELRREETSFYLLFLNEQKYLYPTLGRGNWIIKRDIRTGDFLQAKVFLQNHRDTYVRLFPGEDRSYLDVYLYGRPIYSGIPISVGFEELIMTPFSRILALTENRVDWERLFTDRGYEEWGILKELRDTLEYSTAQMDYVNDGAMNSRGEWVYIETGLPQTGENQGVNCSGFLKWVADGFHRAAPYGENRLLGFDELERRPPGWNREESSWDLNYDERDPRFGLDWTRNIASRLREAFTGLKTEYAAMDVDRVPFYDYKEEVGYPAGELMTILYLLAVDSPGRIYWGAVSSRFRPEGEDFSLWQYYHTALFVPRITKEGNFLCDVFQSGSWTTLEIFQDDYADTWVHLSRSDGLRRFEPADIP